MFYKLFIVPIFLACLLALSSFNPIQSQDSLSFDKSLKDALIHNDFHSVQAAVRNGADINAADSNGDYPLMLAAFYSTTECMKFLLDQHAFPDQKNKSGETALMWCTHEPDKVKLLVSYGADINSKSDYGNTPFLIASKGYGQTEICIWMIQQGADCLARNKSGETALIRAAPFGDTTLIKVLLEKRINITAKDNEGTSALLYACGNENWETAMFLADRIPDNPEGDTILAVALSYVVCYDNLETMKHITRKVKNIDMADKEGYTALMWSVYNEHVYPQMVSELLARNANIDHQAKDGSSAISWAMKKGNTSIVQLLQRNQKKQL